MLKKIILLTTLLAIIFGQITYEEDVAVLNEQNFDEFVETHKHVLVEFYAPWCGHCKQLAPEWARAAGVLKDKDPLVPLAKVDATENKVLQDKYSIEGFPTILMFVDAKHYEYTGPRDFEGIVQWVLKKVGPIGFEINDQETFDKIKSDNQILIMFFLESGESQEYKVYENLARITEVNNVLYAHTFNRELRKYASVSQEGNQIVIFKHFDDLRVDYEGTSWEVPHIYEKFIEKHMYKIILDFDENSAEKIFSKDQEALFLLFSDSTESQSAIQALEDVKYQIKDQITLCQTEIGAGMGERLAEYLNITQDQLPLVMVLDFKGDDMDKFYLEGEITTSSLAKFVDDYKNNNLTASLLSEQAPENNDEVVKTLIGSNFEQTVVNQQKDTFVKFYAPWCGHCKSMIPAYEAVAQHFSNDENIVIGKMDYTKNEVKGLTIEGFPTLKFFPAGINSLDQAEDYDSERDSENIIKFINENRKSSPKQSEIKKDDL